VAKIDGLKREEAAEAFGVLPSQASDNSFVAFWFACGREDIFNSGNSVPSNRLEVVNFANLQQSSGGLPIYPTFTVGKGFVETTATKVISMGRQSLTRGGINRHFFVHIRYKEAELASVNQGNVDARKIVKHVLRLGVDVGTGEQMFENSTGSPHFCCVNAKHDTLGEDDQIRIVKVELAIRLVACVGLFEGDSVRYTASLSTVSASFVTFLRVSFA
jgi:hypothetical protein